MAFLRCFARQYIKGYLAISIDIYTTAKAQKDPKKYSNARTRANLLAYLRNMTKFEKVRRMPIV